MHLEFSSPQCSPSQTLVKGRKNKNLALELAANKRVKMDRRVEVEIRDSDEEIGGSRRRLGRIAKRYGRYKQMDNHSQEEDEDTNSEESDKIFGVEQEKGK